MIVALWGCTGEGARSYTLPEPAAETSAKPEPVIPTDERAAIDVVSTDLKTAGDVVPASAESVVSQSADPAPTVDPVANDTASSSALPVEADSPSPTGTAEPSIEEGIRLLVAEKEFSPERGKNALRVTFDDIDLLKVINLQKVTPDVVTHLPGWLTALSGQRIVLRGWMFPPARASGISRFIFVRDNGVCCFGPNAKIYDKLAVTLKSGQTTRFIEGHAFDVVGTFTIEPDLVDPDNAWLYFLDDAEVLDK